MRPDIVAFFNESGFSNIARFAPTSGFMYVLVFLVCGVVLTHRSRRDPALTGYALDIWLAAGLGASVGARAYFLIINGKLFTTPPSTWIGHPGTASWGAYLGASLLVLAYARYRRLPAWPWLDVAASVAPLGEVIGRWSCWLAGDDFGRVTQVPWGIHFPAGSLAWQAQLARGEITSAATRSLGVHPQQFYLMANALVVFIVITRVWYRARARPGVTFASYLLLYGVTRFGWEFFRDPAAGGASGLLSTSQFACVGCVVVGGVLLVRLRKGDSYRAS